MLVRHYDKIRIDQITETPQGFLKIPMFAARTGTQTYLNFDGTKRIEFRPPEEVFRKETMDSFKHAPITNNHPTEFVTPENAKSLMVGHTTEDVRKVEGKFIGTDAIITDRKAIDDIKSGKAEVSAGYALNLDFTPGEADGVRYDAIQRDIVVNHIAIVDSARAGPRVRLRMDSQDAVVEELYHADKETQMNKKVKIDGKEYEVDEAVATALDAALEAVPALKTQLEDAIKKSKPPVKDDGAHSKKVDQLQARVDASNEEITKLKAVKVVDSSEVRAMVRGRSRAEGVARRLITDAKELDTALALDDKDLKMACIKADSTDKELDLSKQSDAYIDVRFDLLSESAHRSERANSKIGKDFATSFTKEQLDESATKETKSRQDAETAWSKPIPGARLKFASDNT